MVVSVVLEDEASNDAMTSEPVKDIPILLLSPFERWHLNSADSANPLTESLLSELVKSHLSSQ